MSLANSNRANLAAWLGCQDVWNQITHCRHTWITDKDKQIWCSGYSRKEDSTKAGTNIDPEDYQNASLPLVAEEPTYTLTGLSEADLGILLAGLYELPWSEAGPLVNHLCELRNI